MFLANLTVAFIEEIRDMRQLQGIHNRCIQSKSPPNIDQLTNQPINQSTLSFYPEHIIINLAKLF